MFFATTFWGLNEGQWGIIGAIIAGVLLVGGVIAFIVKAIYTAGKFMQRFNTVEATTTTIKDELRQLRIDLTSRIDSLADISIQSTLSEAHSPRQLNELGQTVLKNSGIDTVVNDKFEQIVHAVEAKKPENAYQAEQDVLDVVSDLISDPVIKDAVENGAFQSGHSVAAVLFAGGLYIRDRVLEQLGFLAQDIDNHNPNLSSKTPRPKKSTE